jgi:para-aminobenzoate synthetase/4-amino-4-deoxychorismate lyase
MPWHPLPADLYALVEQTPATVLLENSNVAAAEPISHLFVAPFRVLEASNSAELSDLFAQIEEATRRGELAAGFFAYECGEVFEPVAASTTRHPRRPLAWFGFYDRSYRFDHARGQFRDDDPPGLTHMLLEAQTRQNFTAIDVTPALGEQQYIEHIRKIHEWIRAGDVYQLNFTFPLRWRVVERPSSLYSRLRIRQPVEYGAFLHCRPGQHILCFSPELFFSIKEERDEGRRITTRPMKGTAHRGRTTSEDRQIAAWLRNDAKNRSENVMIVDLIRNDLGRLCAYGGVRVEHLFAVERHPTLWQMTSTVTGDLRTGVGYHDVFRALFPCGSITGAPKIRAMQLISQIEDEPRGIYTGAIGYFSRERTVFNVAIRTVELGGEHAKMGVGSGIVIDADAADEYRECLLKAEFLTSQDGIFSLIETILWEDGYPLLELHLDRLDDSAEYFDFRCDRAAIKAALISLSLGFADRHPRKVRLLLNAEGSIQIEHESLSRADASQEPVRVCMAAQRTDPGNRFFFHKTTHRQLYTSALQAAAAEGFDEVLFLNTRGEVTEGAISNIFLVKAGRWCTPPLESGLLAGVYRRHLLETRPEIEERVLYQSDLETADAIHLSNAVRGLRRVVLDRPKVLPSSA